MGVSLWAVSVVSCDISQRATPRCKTTSMIGGSEASWRLHPSQVPSSHDLRFQGVSWLTGFSRLVPLSWTRFHLSSIQSWGMERSCQQQRWRRMMSPMMSHAMINVEIGLGHTDVTFTIFAQTCTKNRIFKIDNSSRYFRKFQRWLDIYYN